MQPAATNVNVADSGGYVAAAGPGPLYYARRVLSLLFGILITLLILRIVLLLLVADPGNSIVDFVYSVTEPFVAPFRGMFQFDAVASGDRTLDIAALVALIGWTLIYALIMADPPPGGSLGLRALRSAASPAPLARAVEGRVRLRR